MSFNNPNYQRTSETPQKSKENVLIAVLAVVDAALIITAFVLFLNLFSGSDTPEAEPRSAQTSANPSDDSTEPAEEEDQEEPTEEDLEEITGAEVFAAPSGNIICTISSTGVNCSIAKLEKSPEENANNCVGFIGYVVELRATGTNLPCVEKSQLPGAAGSGMDVLDYEKKKTVNNFTCSSLRTGMRCEDTNTGRGFSLARAGIKTF